MSTAPPAAPPLPTDLETLLRGLRLPHIRRAAPEVLATAEAQRWEPGEVLKALLAEEAAGRARSALATRRAAAAFPTGKTFHAWKPELSSIPAPTQQALRTLEWIDRRENLVVCGPSGTGKTFFLEALGQHAVEQGRKVLWFTLEDLGALIRRHRADDSVSKALTRLLRADLVVIDDIGLLAVEHRRRRRALPARRCRLRETRHRALLEPAPRWIRRTHAQTLATATGWFMHQSSNLHPAGFDEAHAQDSGHRHSRSAHASRAPVPDHRRVHPHEPSPRRHRNHTPHLTCSRAVS